MAPPTAKLNQGIILEPTQGSPCLQIFYLLALWASKSVNYLLALWASKSIILLDRTQIY